ncbi:MAG: hypothetical protein KAX49_14055 [Halanaerobiales bacterium]|nr:hypothetical protein [Halanaerobiales bacterium]
MSNKINVEPIWYGIPATEILELVEGEKFTRNPEENGINIESIEKDKENKLIFKLSNGIKSEFTSNKIISVNEIFNYFSNSKNLTSWTLHFLEYIASNRNVLSELKERTFNTVDYLNLSQIQLRKMESKTGLPFIECAPSYTNGLTPILYMWALGCKKAMEDSFSYPNFRADKHLIPEEYITSDNQKITLYKRPLISQLPKIYFIPVSMTASKLSSFSVTKINGVTVTGEIESRLLKEETIHSSFLDEKYLGSTDVFYDFVSNLWFNIEMLVNSTFPDSFFSSEIRENTLLDLYYQSWSVISNKERAHDVCQSLRIDIKSLLRRKLVKEREAILKGGVEASKFLRETTFESLIYEVCKEKEIS